MPASFCEKTRFDFQKDVDYYSYGYSYYIQGGGVMKTVQMTLDENLIASVDRVAKRLGTTRSAFTRQALKTALTEVRMNELERRHREGYKRKPVKHEEFGVWEAEQVWVEP